MPTSPSVNRRLFLVGYGRWPAPKRLQALLEALKGAGVELLIDIRIVPCSSDPDPNTKSRYGPKDWNLQVDGAGIKRHLEQAGIDYLWMPELGNPQPKDPEMAVMRSHLASPRANWPVNRGLLKLRELVPEKRCAILCACKEPEDCHRNLVAEEFRSRYFPDLEIEHLPGRSAR